MKSVEKKHENWQHVVMGLLFLVIMLQLNAFFDMRSTSNQLNRIDSQHRVLKTQLDQIQATALEAQQSAILHLEETRSNNHLLRAQADQIKEDALYGDL